MEPLREIRNRLLNGWQLSKMHTFEVAARHQSFALAAEELSLSPSAVSHRINQLEEELGIQLFVRSHRKVELTHEGKRVYWALKSSLDTLNQEILDIKIGMDVMKNTPSEMFANAIISGWLIATMVWMFPAAGAAKIVVIILMTWLIALGDTTHIVVGSVEILYLVFNGTLHWSDFIWPFALPTLAGNICGGTFIFALMSHAQIRNDMSNKRKAEARQKAERAENIKKNYKNPA